MAKEQYLDFKGLQQYDAIVEEKIRRAVGEIVGFDVVVVNELPDEGVEHTLYLVPSEPGSSTHDEYLWVKDPSTGIYDWELIGTTVIDLSEYAKTADVNAALDLKANKSQLDDYATNASLAEKQDILNASANISIINSEISAVGYTYDKEYNIIQLGPNASIGTNKEWCKNSIAESEGIVSSEWCHAEGVRAIAAGLASHAEGADTVAKGKNSHAEGDHTITENVAEHAQGIYNKSNAGTIHSIGIGSSSERKNAFEVLNDGKVFVNNIGLYNGTSIENVSTLQEVINAKQNTISDLEAIRENASTAVQPNDLSIYAKEADVNASLALKANKEDVNSSLADMNSVINQKADSNYVNEQLGEKANLSYVDASLNLKANKADVDASLSNYCTIEFVNTLIERIGVLESVVITLRSDVDRLDRQANAISYNINEMITVVEPGQSYTDPDGRFTLDMTNANKPILTISNGEELGDYTVPVELGVPLTINGAIKSGATIVNSSTKTLTINNTTESHPNISVVSMSNATVSMSGNFRDVEFSGTTLSAANSSIIGNVIISDDVENPVTINAKLLGEPTVVSSSTSQPITINPKNASANIEIDCPNATVTIGTGTYDELTANVSDNTLKFSSLNTYVKTLHLKHGNIFINNGKDVLNDLVGEVIADSSYTVDWNKATVIPNSPAACEYTLSEDKTNAVTWGTFASGNTVINLNGHTIHNNGTDGRPTMNVRGSAIVDINGNGTVSNDNEYAVWGNAVGTTININGGYYRGTSHAIYSYAGTIYINDGEFILNGNDYEKDAHGHAKFLINCYDANFTAEKARIIVKGGKFHNFNPAEAYGEPTQPWNYVAAGYKSVCIDEENQIFEVIPE